MSYRHTLEASLESLHEIEALVKGFPGNGDIPPIEIDLVLQKVRNIYELMLMLKNQKDELVVAAASKVNDEEIPVMAKVTTMKEKEPAVKETTASKSAPVKTEPQTLADQFKGQTTLYESLHKTFNHDDDKLAHAKPVVNLLAAIGLNDKFTFMRELFNNDSATFENAMKLLDESASFNDAYNYMIQHFDWDMDSEPVQRLLDIVRRKYIKGSHE